MKKRAVALPLIAVGFVLGSLALTGCGGDDPPAKETVTATIANTEVAVGQTVTLAPVYSKVDSDAAWTFTPADATLATFSGLSVTGVKAGETQVAGVDANDVAASFKLTVKDIQVTATNQTFTEGATITLSTAITATYTPDGYDPFGWEFAFSAGDGVTASDIVTYDEDTDILSAAGKAYGVVTVTATNEKAPTQTFTVTVNKADYVSMFNTAGQFEGTLDSGFVTGDELASSFAISQDNHRDGTSSLNFWCNEDVIKKGTISYTVKHLDPTKTYAIGYYVYGTATVYSAVKSGEVEAWSTWSYKDGNWDRYFITFSPETDTAVFTLTVETSSWGEGESITWNKWAAIDSLSIQEGTMFDVIAKDGELLSLEGSEETLSFDDLAKAYASDSEATIAITAVSADTTKLVVDNETKTVKPVANAEGTVGVTFTAKLGEVEKTVTVNIVIRKELTAVDIVNAAGTFTNNGDDWHVVSGCGFSGIIGAAEWVAGDSRANGGTAYNVENGKHTLYIKDLSLDAAEYVFSIKAQGAGNVTLSVYDSSVECTEEGFAAATAIATKTEASTGTSWTDAQTISLTVTPTEAKTVTLVLVVDSTNWLCVDDLTAEKKA